MRRHDSLSRMAVTLLAALLCGAVLEADGIHTWAQRLTVGPLRDAALPATTAWQTWTAPLQLARPRDGLLAMKASLAPAMLARQPSPVTELAMTPAAADLPLLPAVHAAALPASATPATPASARLAVSLSSTVAQAKPVSASTVSAGTPVATADAVVSPAVSFPTAGIEVALAGDSMMAVGLAPTLKRWLAEQKSVHVIPAYRSGTGLSRPEVFDWISEYPRMLGQSNPALVICAMGANDAQSVQVGKKVLQFDTPEWDAFFRARLVAYLDILTKKKPHVLWVGLPPMRNEVFSKKMAHLNELLKTTLAGYPNTTWLDPRTAMGGPDGQGFQQFRAQHNGKMVKLRADDGIHLTDDGALYLLPPIRTWVAQAVDSKPPVKPALLTDAAPVKTVEREAAGEVARASVPAQNAPLDPPTQTASLSKGGVPHR